MYSRLLPEKKSEKGCLCGRGRLYTAFRAANAFCFRVPRRVFFSDTSPKCLEGDCVGRHRTGTRHGNVYRSERKKQEIVVYQ